WHEAGQRVIYAAEHYSTAMLEKLVHFGGELPNGQHYVELYRGRTFLLVEKDAAGEWQITGYYTNTREDNIHAAELIEWVKYTNTNPIYSEPNDIARGLKVMAQAGFRVTVGTISIVVSELAHMIPEAAHYLLALAGLVEPTQQPHDDVVPRRRN
ncbi:hypothetical protein EBZ39_08875, partial [bacterium]|nr:hypothetical protein [bacterium]